MEKLVGLLANENGKAAMNEWENDDSDKLRALYSGYIELVTFFSIVTC